MTKIGIDNEVIELKGEAEQVLLDQKTQDQGVFDDHQAMLEAKASAKQALMDKLGITENEATLIFG